MKEAVKRLDCGTCCENGINPKAVYDFITRCEEEDLGVNSMMLLKNGKVVAQGCHTPYSNETKHIMYSLSKSVTATALGFAVDEGKISLDDSICMFFPEYGKRGKNADITVRHLVTMTSGKLIGMAKNRHDKEWVKIFFDSPSVAKPGKVFMYLNDNFYMLSAIISRVYGETLVDFLYPRLFEPLGIEKPVWETDKFGYAAGGWGLYLSVEDVSKIMLCYAQNGKWDGKQILSEKWVEEATSYQVPTVKRGHIDNTMGYGYGFWQTSLPDTYRAYGLHGQFGYVFKGKDTVLTLASGISKDEHLSDAINEMFETLWDEPVAEYEEKLQGLLSSLGDKDDLPETERNTELEHYYNHRVLKTHSSSFASMLNATVTTVMDEAIGHIDRFSLSLEGEDLYLTWNEGLYINKIKLGMHNRYEYSDVVLAGLNYTACSKAAWTKEKELTVLVRLEQTCHVRRLIFDFSDEKKIRIKNDSFPDMPNLAAHYMDFSGFPLPPKIEKLLVKYVAPGVLLLGEPNFKVS